MTAVGELLAGARGGRIAATARLLSIVENDDPEVADVVRATMSHAPRAARIGITGPPGAGKSTLVSALVAAYRRTVPRVAVVAVDPSSPYTGGAILGDRIRMRDRALDPGVYFRSMSNRGASGGLARATRRIVDVLDAVGFDVVLVETVGAGQQEVDVARVADTVCLLAIPGAGDDVQAIKAGILEVADIVVVNKADRPGAEETARDLIHTLNLGAPRTDWKTPVIRTSAIEGAGIEDLVAAVARHREWAIGSGATQRRRAEGVRIELEGLMRERVLSDLARRIGSEALDLAVSRVVERELDPYDAVDLLLRGNSSE